MAGDPAAARDMLVAGLDGTARIVNRIEADLVRVQTVRDLERVRRFADLLFILDTGAGERLAEALTDRELAIEGHVSEAERDQPG